MIRDLSYKNRSYRGFDNETFISTEDLRNFVDAARVSASSVNLQPLKYYIANTREQQEIFMKHIRFARKLPKLNLPFPGTEPTSFVMIMVDTEITTNVAAYKRDIGIAAQTIMLAAVEAGFGGCMIGNFDLKELPAELGISERYTADLVLALGKPQEEIVLVDLAEGASTDYYRDEQNVHYVPKRSLDDIILS